MNSFKYGTISTGSKEASFSAEQILKKGGNAFDAAVGAVFVSMTSEFALTGPFGGGTCVGMKNNTSPFVYDFFVDCPESTNDKKEFEEVAVNFGSTIQKFHIGKGSIAVPGNIAGLIKIHNDHGDLPLKEVLSYSILYAKNGIKITSYQSYIMGLIKPILTFSNNDLFIKNNSLISKGDTFKNPYFSDFLNILIDEGVDYFYKENGLNDILEYLGANSCLQKSDFSNYKVHKRRPISIDLNGYTIYTNPAPSYGGTLIIFLLNLLKDNKNFNISALIKGMNLVSKAREEICINPNDENEISQILSKKNIKKYNQIFSSDDKIDTASDTDGFGSTTHVSIMDKKGNAVSITTTNGEGCGSIIPKYGIMMNNMLGEVDLNPFGFHKWQIRRRLPTMISPIIVTKNSKPIYILGSGGSNRIRSANIQVLINLLIKNMSLNKAIDEPRIHLEGNTLFYEPGIILPEKYNSKYIHLNRFDDKNLFFGGVNAVSSNEAIADKRRGGTGIFC
ncbi:MAG: hypothetical protein CMD65_05165 [Gammaproteobacteria bacterium]|nr:hypothetical protein [Gammaproteobacteria bacterium]